MSSLRPGMRLSFSDVLCTVRYHGPLPDQGGDWLGVEWDDPHRGKHHGQYKGRRLFETLSSFPSCASFLRTSRVPDQPRSFLEALRHKYAEEGLEQATTNTQGSIEISGKVVEEVGFERIRKQQALLQELKIVVLDGLRIRGRGAGDGAEVVRFQDEIASACPNITELDLSRNLFESWRDVAEICLPLKRLRTLKASGLRLSHFDLDIVSSFQHVEELHLHDCLLKLEQVLAMLSKKTENGTTKQYFPALTSLSIAGNNLRTLDMATIGLSEPFFSSVRTLSLDNNAFTSLVPLCRPLVLLFPNLSAISLQHNQISSFTYSQSSSEEPIPVFSSIASLNLAHNAIITPTLISCLPQLFPNLTSLRVSNNPFFTSSTSTASRTDEAAFMLTLARLPTLKTLNYSAITDKDRMEGELYYLSVARKEISQVSHQNGSLTSEELHSLRQTWTRYDELCHKYEMDNMLDILTRSSKSSTAPQGCSTAGSTKQRDSLSHPTYPPGSLGARLITITFLLSAKNTTTTSQSHTLTIPRTLDVYRVKALLLRKMGREWGLRPLDFGFELLSLPPGDESHGVGGAAGEGAERENKVADAEYEDIPDSTRGIGDWIKEGAGECTVRVKPREREGEKGGEGLGFARMDLGKLMVL